MILCVLVVVMVVCGGGGEGLWRERQVFMYKTTHVEIKRPLTL